MPKRIFSLDVRRARKGDCLLLHYGTDATPGLMLIDGGPSKVYGPHLKPRLLAIRQARGLNPEEALPVDLLLVSHIDDDHIKGILELTQELIAAADERSTPLVRIRSLWHNAFDDIIGNDPHRLLSSVTATFGAASLSGETPVDGLDPDTSRVLASVPQGYQLRNDARKLKIPMNTGFNRGPVMASRKTPRSMKKGLEFIVAGPLKQELAALQKEHDEFLKKEERKKSGLAAFTDTSVANLSSIVVLARSGGKEMLLTGDARGDKILTGMEQVGLLQPGGTRHVDLLKVPHHGSDRNMATSFFQRITADHYVFSGDGEHGNPERETFRMLLEARGDAEFTVHLTYPVDEIDAERKAEAKQDRKPWSDRKDSLGSFLTDHPALARRIRVVDRTKPHVIDLRDPLGY